LESIADIYYIRGKRAQNYQLEADIKYILKILVYGWVFYRDGKWLKKVFIISLNENGFVQNKK
jgi:hypothetical protein